MRHEEVTTSAESLPNWGLELLVCPTCRGDLELLSGRARCVCGADYEVQDGIPVLVSERSELEDRQAAWFDYQANDEWEIERPHGAPALYGWLMREKFRRSVRGVALRGATALVVCAGSGMDAEFLAGAGAEVIALDISIGAAQRAAERARRHQFEVGVVVGDAARLPFRDASIDVVYVHDGLHHLERPLSGLAEMARVARHAVCVSEPARAAVTGLAARFGLALEHEESGNRVARLSLDDARSTLTDQCFQISIAERYCMYYRHEPGPAVRFLSHQPLLGLAQVSFRVANTVAGPARQQTGSAGSAGAKVSRILVWSPNYAPELTGIPPLVTDACDWLAARGHTVQVVTAFPNYPHRQIDPAYRGSIGRSEVRRGVAVHRSWLRVRPRESFLDKALYEASFTALSLPHVLRRARQTDVLVCVVPSLLAAAAAAGLSRAGGPRLVIWWQDLVLNAARSLDGLGPLALSTLRGARAAERVALRAADGIVSCSPGFVTHLVEQGGQPQRIVIVLNWVDTNWITPTEPAASETTRVLYAGNLGYTQGFETVIEAMRLLPDEVELEFVGDGNAAPLVRQLVDGMPRIHVRPPVRECEFPGLLASAHVQLVLQRRVGAGANLPSKIGPYLASGRPVVASIDPATPAADLLKMSGGALLVPPEDPQALAQALWRLHTDQKLRDDLAQRGRAFAVTTLDREGALVRLEQAFLGHPVEPEREAEVRARSAG